MGCTGEEVVCLLAGLWEFLHVYFFGRATWWLQCIKDRLHIVYGQGM